MIWGVHKCTDIFAIFLCHFKFDFGILIDGVLVIYTVVEVGKSDVGIIKFDWVVLMDYLLELVLEALHHCLEDVIHLFCCFVVNEKFTRADALVGMLSWYLPGMRGC